MFQEIIHLFLLGLDEEATSKTNRYFIGRPSFIQETVNVMYTLMFIRHKGKKGTIKVGSEYYSTNDYEATPNIVELIQCGKVWVSPGAVGCGKKPWVVQPKPSSKVMVRWRSDEEVEYQCELLAPDQVSNYFRRYNDNQTQETKLEVTQIQFMKEYSLDDFSHLVIKTKNRYEMVKQKADGKNECVSYFNRILAPYSVDYCDTCESLDDRRLGLWLISKKLSE